MTLLETEFDGCDLGDERRESRLQQLVEALARHPEMSFPEALGYGKHLEAAYRFLNNPAVDAGALLRPHQSATVARIQQHKRVLILSDTTHMQPSAKAIREGFGVDGFRTHTSLAVTSDGSREPLGVIALESWARPDREEGKPAKRDTQARRHDENRESKRWLKQSLEVEALVTGVQLIHVEDREADIYESLAERCRRGMSFIVRSQSSRKVIVDDEVENILQHVRKLERLFSRTVTLSRRAKTTWHTSHPERDGRKATLAIAAAAVVIRLPRFKGEENEPLALNAVHVIEQDGPLGEPAVEWLLITTEPISTPQEIEFVVDSYRTRWMIEEYFKALKSGCAYEARQLESYEALQSALSIFAVIAWRLLWLRYVSRTNDGTPATRVMSDVELKILRAQGRVGEKPTAVEALRAVAALGGHLKPNGDPGWEVIWRGFRALRHLVSGYLLALEEK